MLNIGLFYKDYTKPGGMPIEFKCLVEELEKLGHKITIYCYGKKNETKLVSERVIIHQYKNNLSWLVALPSSFNSDLENIDFDCFFLVSAHLPENYMVSKKLLKNKIKYIYCIGGAYNPYLLDKKPFIVTGYKHLIELPILNNADIVRSYSKTNTEFIKNYGGLRPIFELYEGVCLEDVPKSISKYNFNNKKINLVYLGRIDYKGKGIDELLHCFNNTDISNFNIKLNIYGPMASKKDEYLFKSHLKDFTDDLVEYHGAVYGEEKFSILKSCDLFIYPSRFEGIPRSIREALFFGAPVIVTKETNFAENVVRFNAGFVCETAGDSIYNSLQNYLSNSDKKKLSINAKRLVDELYNWNSINKQLKTLLKRYEN